MTAREQHHPPHDHPDFDAYLNTLTEDDLATINATTLKIYNDELATTPNDIPER
jgi:hypothetical protein